MNYIVVLSIGLVLGYFLGARSRAPKKYGSITFSEKLSKRERF